MAPAKTKASSAFASLTIGGAQPGRCANASCWTVWIVVALFLMLMLFHFSSDTASDFIVLRYDTIVQIVIYFVHQH